MSFNRAVRTYVVATAITAVLVLFITYGLDRPLTNWWAIGSFFLVGALLEFSRTQNKTGGLTGSLVFVFHLAAGLVLGGFWGALTAGLVKAISQLHERSPSVKFIFNVSERVVSVGLAFTVYHLIGGKHPPDILLQNGMNNVNVWPALQQVGMFLAAAVVYFVVNSGCGERGCGSRERSSNSLDLANEHSLGLRLRHRCKLARSARCQGIPCCDRFAWA